MVVIKSPYPDVEIPNVDIYTFLFENLTEQQLDRETFIDVATSRSITLRALRLRIEHLARALSHPKTAWGGWKKGEVFALFSPNHVDYPVALWAVLRAGGVVTTMNPSYTATEVSYQLTDSRSKAILTTTTHLSVALTACRASGVNIPASHIFIIDAPGVTYKAEGHTFYTLEGLVVAGEKLPPTPRVKVGVDETALLMYSSGTTGRSKGVESTHRNIVTNVLQVSADGVGMALPGDTIVGVLPFYHCYGLTYTVHWSVYAGLRNVVFGQFKLETFLDAVKKYKVNVAHLVPPIMIQLAKNPIVEKADFSSLRWIVSGAAPMAAELGVEVRQRCGAQIKQAWGMTELSPVSTIEPCGRVIDGSVGVLLPNQEAKIVHPETLKELGYNEEGELLVRGPNRMKGYLNNPEANANTITTDGYLRTGDLAVVDENGVFYIRDRLKELIKVKGFQVAPAELEGLLLTHEAVADCAVIPIDDAYSGEIPKAFIVLKSTHVPSSPAHEKTLLKKILDHVHADLARHKHIGGVEVLEAIPKTASGKILRRTLRDMEREKAAKRAGGAKL
ncbi:AMP-dependent synthetase and ligase [Gonapodya prolifera JEL478]|uniref:AMP-dependent synthetase and ligase n=1 Tax=Gonapodya prolifera (strain JEL478) TaxID=1344416 RepID=A0A139AHB5_GONPJ|nr:AMP-dependent synthetase and ligase [Gonapodya prolifera JEL478]|eukprot:KXS16196.1 AMP-dependent synthetase and ligase [Gonapodya prolifera JEL478]